MSYEIKIFEKIERVKKKPRVWTKIGTKEEEREPRFIGPNDPSTYITDVMGYAPEIEATVVEEVEIFKQYVEILDLPAVIRAINRLN